MNKILDLSQQLIRIESVKGNTEAFNEVLHVVQEELDEFNVKPFYSNGVESLVFSNTDMLPDKFKVMLNAHLDVVPGEPDQFKPEIRGDKLYGRGAYDMKAAAAVEILAFKDLAKQVDYPLGLQIVTDEEIGGYNGAKYQRDKGVKADFVIVGEPTDFNIKNQAKGIIWIKVTFKGTSAHGAYPWLGDSAIWKAKRFLDQIEQTFPVPTDDRWQTTVNVGSFQTINESYNKVPDECSLLLDIRYIPEEGETIRQKVADLLPKDAEVHYQLNDPSHSTPTDHILIKILQEIIKPQDVNQSQIISANGGSDIRFYSEIGSDGIEFGPIGQGHHTEEEWVSISSLETYDKILRSWLKSI